MSIHLPSKMNKTTSPCPSTMPACYAEPTRQRPIRNGHTTTTRYVVPSGKTRAKEYYVVKKNGNTYICFQTSNPLRTPSPNKKAPRDVDRSGETRHGTKTKFDELTMTPNEVILQSAKCKKAKNATGLAILSTWEFDMSGRYGIIGR